MLLTNTNTNTSTAYSTSHEAQKGFLEAQLDTQQ